MKEAVLLNILSFEVPLAGDLDWYFDSGFAHFSSDGFLALTKHSFRKAFRFITVAVWRN